MNYRHPLHIVIKRPPPHTLHQDWTSVLPSSSRTAEFTDLDELQRLHIHYSLHCLKQCCRHSRELTIWIWYSCVLEGISAEDRINIHMIRWMITSRVSQCSRIQEHSCRGADGSAPINTCAALERRLEARHSLDQSILQGMGEFNGNLPHFSPHSFCGCQNPWKGNEEKNIKKNRNLSCCDVLINPWFEMRKIELYFE